MPRAPLGYGKESHFTDKGYQLHGVVHVGANDGEEITWYAHVGRTPVLAFEPLPDMYLEACDNYAPEIAEGKVKIVNAALGDETGKLTLIVASNEGIWDTKGASAKGAVPVDSALRMGWIPPHTTKEVEAEVYRFDDWVTQNNVDLFPYDTLVIDVQGMELEVLKGFGDCLDNFNFLMVECSHPPLYEGEADAEEVEAYLATKGFRRDSPIVSHNDVMFLRELV